MKKILLGLLFSAQAFAQQGIATNYLRMAPTSLPASCNQGDLRFSAGSDIYEWCNGSSTWSAFANASTAAQVVATQETGNTRYYPILAGSSLSGNQSPYIATGLSFNPGTDVLTASNFVGSLSGSATSITGINPTANGGTGSNLTGISGTIPYFYSATGTSVLAPGTNGQVLTQGNSTLSWTTVSAVPTTYFENTSSAAQTVTMPAPISGAFVYIKDISGNAQNKNITINHNSSENIDGATSQTLTFNYGFANFLSDGSNWYTVAKNPNITAPSSVTLTFTSLGTLISQQLFAYRNANMYNVYGTITTGVPSTAGASVTLPSGIAIDTSKMSTYANGSKVGEAEVFTAGTNQIVATAGAATVVFLYYNGSNPGGIYFSYQTSSSTYSNENASTYIANGNPIYLNFTIPVSGWGVY